MLKNIERHLENYQQHRLEIFLILLIKNYNKQKIILITIKNKAFK